MRFTDLAAEHAARLDSLAREPQWEALISSGAVDAARESMMVPSRPVNVFKLPVEQLQRINEPSVRALIGAGERNEDRLLDALGTWPEKWPADVPVRLSFVGVNLDFACDMSPRCIYCNQRSVERRMTPQHWLALVRSVIPEEGEGPYLFITGGEPLLEGEALWGPQGIIRAATAAGAACNVNTNGLRLTPEVALQLVSSGLSRLHVSLDSHLPEVQDAIYGCSGRWATVVRGIHNLQLAKRLLGAEHPVIHINSVLTRLNAPGFPGFLRFLLGMKLAASGPEARDFDLHLIPVGGDKNQHLRLPAEEYERFFTETWDAANVVWEEFQRDWEVPDDQRGPIHAKVPYMSPFHRVRHSGDLCAWAEKAATGRPAALSATRRCYVGPTQAFILPDGAQYWCGGHATCRPEPVGNVLEASVQENIARKVGQMRDLPGTQCVSCPGATQAINQSVENALRELIRSWLNPPSDEQQPRAAATEPDASAFE